MLFCFVFVFVFPKPSNFFFADAIHAVPVRFSEDPQIVEKDLEEDVVGVNSDPNPFWGHAVRR